MIVSIVECLEHGKQGIVTLGLHPSGMPSWQYQWNGGHAESGIGKLAPARICGACLPEKKTRLRYYIYEVVP